MMKVLFFASYREQLNCNELMLSADEQPATLSELRKQLSEKGDDWREVMEDGRTLVAVNQAMTRRDAELKDGDEVAFFPPVTGG
ncbi:molybdopterin synthase small subunit [Endozoicomonas montiporae]|uniref:Molybdopterin synthase sulfur carrier subunit n=2 Tax=Endozoicomonas montiporae TaxID=1027273 RepID=A0A081N742_9GAMM|nr:molybdopterin converting factor subunit 1 [Endozoicomonas montiporae]AMO55917.1 molybdopterin synthase small subunit [Endozoicomonas montiporae CL-33]KEQ14265.1 molybdopterin synthase small subunit [Endozoicomonas montiporae]